MVYPKLTYEPILCQLIFWKPGPSLAHALVEQSQGSRSGPTRPGQDIKTRFLLKRVFSGFPRIKIIIFTLLEICFTISGIISICKVL